MAFSKQVNILLAYFLNVSAHENLILTAYFFHIFFGVGAALVLVDEPLSLYPGISRSVPGSSCLLDETLSHGPVSISS